MYTSHLRYPPGSYHSRHSHSLIPSLGLGALRAAWHDLGRGDADDEAEEQGLGSWRGFSMSHGEPSSPLNV